MYFSDLALNFLDSDNTSVVYFTPQAKLLNQKMVKKFAAKDRVILLCGHYKEIDQRIRDIYIAIVVVII